ADHRTTEDDFLAPHPSRPRKTLQRIRSAYPPAVLGTYLLAGVIGSLFAIAVMIALRLLWGAPTAPELVGELILPRMSAGQFVALLIRFQPYPKTGPLGLALISQFVLGVLIAPVFLLAARVREQRASRLPGKRGWLVAGAVALIMEVVAAALFWPVLAANPFGNPPGQARLITLLSLLVTFAVYAAVSLVSAHLLLRAWGQTAATATSPTPAERQPSTEDSAALPRYTRRRTLEAAGATVAVVGIGALATNRLIQSYLARSNLAYEGAPTPASLVSPITPAENFYVVSKNVIDPTVIADHWQLQLTGLIRKPITWTLAEFRALPSETRAITLECISNGVGGHLMSTGQWRGTTLETLLALGGGVAPNGKYVVFTSVDGYQTGLPLADLLQARTLLAWQMNGAPLPDRHGYPVRVVVPGRYGEQSAKWVTRIEVTDVEVKGFYQSQGWSAAQLETTSRIDSPTRRAAHGEMTVTGIAFAGIRGIQAVEISADGGATWHQAILAPPLSDQTWVFWSWIWRPTAPGSYTLLVRATDGTGSVQTPIKRGTVPNGATGWDTANVIVE
ncbi:MAG TPA: molybdopterin-dependent oxidoreductase, partial [Ktedonobacterales bacterium]